MKLRRRPPQSWRSTHSGTATVEFALVSALFFTLLIGIMEFGRVLFYWNSAEEATRLGARIAVVCNNDAAAIAHVKVRMREMFPQVPAANIQIIYPPAGCISLECKRVTVSIVGDVPIATYIPFVNLSLALPPFTTSLPTESMKSINGPVGFQTNNPVCS